MKIAIVEDEPKLASILSEYLVKDDFDTVVFNDGSEALTRFSEVLPDLILLDLMLPGTDGMTICRELRKISNIPIIMLTARVEEIDRLLGLEIGADDYICKPYSPREVVARVKAVLRRSADTAGETSQTSDFILDDQAAQVTIKGHVGSLTAVELMLLKTMHAHPGRIFNRNQLMTRIYPDNRIVSDRTIDSHVKKLRQKLQDLDTENEYIHSVYGMGYKFERNN